MKKKVMPKSNWSKPVVIKLKNKKNMNQLYVVDG